MIEHVGSTATLATFNTPSMTLKNTATDTESMATLATPPEIMTESRTFATFHQAKQKTRQKRCSKKALSSPTSTALSLLQQADIQAVYLTEPQQAAHAVQALATTSAVLGLDLETAKQSPWQNHVHAGLDPYLSQVRLVQVATTHRVAVFDLHYLSLDLLAPLWSHPLVAHNAMFELKHLLHAGVNPTQLHCSLLMDRVLSGQRRSLANLAADYLNWSLDKTLQVSDWGCTELSPEQIAYAALDAVAVCRIYPLLRAKLEGGLHQDAYYLLLRAQRPVALMELAGCPFDAIAHHALCAQWSQEEAAAYTDVKQVLGPEVSPTSPKQVGMWLTEQLCPERLAVWPRSPKGQLRTGADALALAADLPVVKPLLTHKIATKHLTTYGHPFTQWISPVTNRIHGSFLIAHAASGRFSAREPNLQQLPRRSAFRQLIKAGPGYQIVVADYSQVELRVMALLCQDAAMLTAYRQGLDLHRLTAAAVKKIALDQVSKDDRQMAKAVNFGLLFGQGAKGLERYAKTNYGVVLSLAGAKAAHQTFFNTYPQLGIWHQETRRLTEQTQQTRIRGGLIRDFRKEKNGVQYTTSLNTPVQGAAAAAMLATLPLLHQALQGLDARIINLIHDEVVMEVAHADVAAAKIALVTAMTAGFLAIFPEAEALGTIRDLVEAHSGPDWDSAKG